MILNEMHKKRIQESLESGDFDLNSEVNILIEHGFSQEEATKQVKSIVNNHRQNLFDQKMKKDESSEYQKIVLFVVVAIGLVGPVANITSSIWYGVAFIIVAGLGYWTEKKKPLVSIISYIVFVATIPFTYNAYMSGRTSILKIELLIPIGLALLVSIIIGYIISTVFYPKK